MKIKKVSFYLISIIALFSLSAAALAAQPVIKAELDAIRYKIDDIIKVRVNIQSNPGLHGLYFDMDYNANVLAFEEIKEANLTGGYPQKGEVHYAVSPSMPGQPNAAHVIVSYTLEGEEVETKSTGTVVEIHFRVKSAGTPGEEYSFDFRDCGVIDGQGNQVTGAAWQPSDAFTIEAPYTGAYIHITEPYAYQVLYKENTQGITEDDPFVSYCDASVTLTQGDYKVKIYNVAFPEEAAAPVSVTTGFLLDTPVPLAYKFNKIKAELYDINDVLLATDTVTVYLSPDDQFVKIRRPQDHALLNTDMVEVEVASPYDVEVNGLPATFYAQEESSKIYLARVWLKKGFNTITATARSPEDVTYKDSIEVYYQKDSALFNFLLPIAGESFKPAEGAKLFIKGEIGSMYGTSKDPGASGPVPNIVTLDLVYSPNDRTKPTRKLVDNQRAVIAESDFGYELARAKYVFYNDFDIPLEGLGNGELLITAYKNREGASWEDRITRVAYIDDNRLWIDLVQPNVFSSDILDTQLKVRSFNELKEFSPDASLTLSGDGSFILANADQAVEEQGISGIRAVEESPDCTLYALKNTANGTMSIYKKGLEDKNWTRILQRSGMYGYTLCSTDIGLLVGVSNLFTSSDSGLYLLKENSLVNIGFPEALPHVQFVNDHSGMIYLYGNYYTYLYSFDIFSLKEEGGRLKAGELSKTPLSNNDNLKQFFLAKDNQTAVIRTDSGSISFYNRTTTGYVKASLPESEGSDEVAGTHVIPGEYESGDYTTFLVFKQNHDAEIIMKNRKTQKYYRHLEEGGLDTWLQDTSFGGNKAISQVWAGFRDDHFTFVYNAEGAYYARKAQIFFHTFYPKGELQPLALPGVVSQYNSRLFTTEMGSYLLQFGPKPDSSLPTEPLLCFYATYTQAGNGSFNYVNDDIDGLTGFSFEVDPRWLDWEEEPPAASPIELGFSVKMKQGEETSLSDPVRFEAAKTDLSSFLNLESDLFSVSHHYDAGVGREVVHVEFAQLQEGAYIHFELTVKPVGNTSPALYNLRIFKKIPVVLTRTGEETLILPIHGYIYDRTVKEVTIQHAKVSLERDGSFYYQYRVDSKLDTIPMEISCYNSAGERAELKFHIQLIDSINAIGLVQYKIDEADPYIPLEPSGGSFIIETVNSSITVSGKYYGLAGAVLGYELLGYNYQDGKETLVLLERDLFETVKDEGVYAELGSENLGPGYEAGYFTDQEIALYPGLQRLIVYCENPGGLRAEYTVNGEYPEFNYNMPEGEQKIVFYLDEDLTGVITGGVPITKQVLIDAYESENPPYVFTREYEISGEIRTLYSTNLIVKSFTNGLVFKNGQDQTTIEVDATNRFTFPFTVTMGDAIEKDFDIGVIPDSPPLTNLKNGVRVHVKKCFENTNFIPDFSAMLPEAWTQEEKESLSIRARLGFNRQDIPLPHYTYATLICNYEQVTEGWIGFDPGNPGRYTIMNDEGGIQYLTGIKTGKNRISWKLQYVDPVEGYVTMSSSNSGKPGMHDEIFEYYDAAEAAPTLISFSEDLSAKFYGTGPDNLPIPLPALNITKDPGTQMSILLNEQIIDVPWVETGTVDTLAGYDISQDDPRQGKNELVIRYTEKLKEEEARSFGFLYDTHPPAVTLKSYELDEDYSVLKEITALVKEANYAKAFLYHGPDIVDRLPEIIILGEDMYELKWSGLESLNIRPAIAPVKAEVEDLTGKRASSEEFAGLADIERPQDTELREVAIDLPEYTGDPVIANDALYTERPFPEHTKFAPERFLKRTSVKTRIDETEGYLIRNLKMQKVVASDGGGSCFGYSVSVSEDYAIVGAPGDFGYANSVHVFERDGDGNWVEVQKLIESSGGPETFFGFSVSVSGDYAIVGAWGDDYKGAAYVFEREASGNWVQAQKLVASDGSSDNRFGFSVSVSGDYAIIGAYRDDDKGLYSGSAYVFKRNDSGNWVEEQKLVASDGATYDWFGRSVSVSGDYAIMGATGDDDKGDDSGSAYVFKRNDSGNWVEVQKLTASDGAGANRFGQSVSVSGDYAIVGASGRLPGSSTPGSAYVFKRNDSGNWVEEQKLVASDGAAYDHFGYSVSVSGDYVIVGTLHNYGGGGSAYVFKRNDSGNWVEVQKLTPDVSNYPFSSCPVSVSGEYAVIGVSGIYDPNTKPNLINSCARTAYIYSDFFRPLSEFSSDMSVPEDSSPFLVFKFVKDPTGQGIKDKTDIEGKIKFEVFGFKQNPANLAELIEVSAVPRELILADTDHKYIEGDSHVYYMVDIQNGLKPKFLQAADTIVFASDDLIVDRAALRIKYDDSLQGELPVDIFLTGEAGNDFSDIIVYDPGYEDPAFDPETDPYISLHPDLDHSPSSRTALHDEASDVITLYCWLRIEDETLNFNPDFYMDLYKGEYRRLLTLNDPSSMPLIHMGYQVSDQGLDLAFHDETQPAPPQIIQGPLALGSDAWNLVALKIDTTARTIEVFLNGIHQGSITDLPTAVTNAVLEEGAEYIFGSAEGEYFNTGFYSIADPVYINRLLSPEEIARLYNLWDNSAGGERTYTFSDSAGDFGQEPYKLRVAGGADYFEPEENADYTEPAGHGSFKASSENRNLLKVLSLEPGKNCVIFASADSYTRYSIEVEGGEKSFTLTPKGTKGRYYFGDKNGNYGLGFNDWYSLSGTVEDLEPGAEASLVLRINRQEQSTALKKGPFHFIYENSQGLIPEEVKVYIETTGRITLSTDLVFNEGNYVLTEDLEETSASTSFPFGLEGTVDFWYKPLIANNHGFVSYPSTLLDSEYIKIGTEIPSGEEEAVFYAVIKQNPQGDPGITLKTDVKVTHGWQHIQLSYSTVSRLVYLYIDGKIAGYREYTGSENLPVFGSLVGDLPAGDNVLAGSNKGRTEFAQGYIDNLYIGQYYAPSKFADKRPARLSYDNEALKIDITYSEGIETHVESITYKLETIDQVFVLSGNTFPIDTSSLPGGRYRLNTYLVINGHNFKDILTFNVDGKPKFDLKEKTPILFKNVPADIRFKFGYDRSYQFETEKLTFAGIAAKITYNSGAESRVRYITQDFIDQDTMKWLVGEEESPGSVINWAPLSPDNGGHLNLVFNAVASSSDVEAEFKCFYITGTFNDGSWFDSLPQADRSETIPAASIHYTIIEDAGGNQYKLVVDVSDDSNAGSASTALFDDIEVDCYVEEINSGASLQGSYGLNNAGRAELYYDDILPTYGHYECTLKLKYAGIVYLVKKLDEHLVWEEKTVETDIPTEIKDLEIEDFSLLYMDTYSDKATFLLKYTSNGVGQIDGVIDVIFGGKVVYSRPEGPLPNTTTLNTIIVSDVVIPKGATQVRITLQTKEFLRTRIIEVSNSPYAPELIITNGVDSLITYNNVFFSWKGYYKGRFNKDIAYTYNFDYSGWTSESSQWRSARFFNLAEGYHTFQAKAVYQGIESAVQEVTFFVDIHRPLFHDEKITVEQIYDQEDVLYGVKIVGVEGAVEDASLTELYAAGEKLVLGEKGSFSSGVIYLTKDGLNSIVLTAYDKVENYTNYTVSIDNTITQIIFPDQSRRVVYSPLTVVGKIASSITSPMSIYLCDPFTTDKGTGDYSTWKKATINEDRTFFVEDVFVNPGTREQELLTTLRLACVFDSGKAFEREIDVWANEIVMPIEMKLSTHAAEGENSDTYAEIDCKANVPNISSWSVDFDGDGVYDLIDLVQNTSSDEAKAHRWTHKYSSLGLVRPRVRVITVDGNFFSVCDTLIIHEKIKDASPNLIENPLSLTAVNTPLKTQKVFVLRSDNQDHLIDIYTVPQHDARLINTGRSINLSKLFINNPVKVRALDEDHLFVASNDNGIGIVYQLVANDFGNFQIERTLYVDDDIRGLSCDKSNLFVSFVNRSSFVKAEIKESLLDPDTKEEFVPAVQNAAAVGSNADISADDQGLLISDFQWQRIIRLSHNLNVTEQFGSLGVGEGEFIKPALVQSYENRIFVFDDGRKDVQVFDAEFGLVCTLEYNPDPEYHNYVENGFFQDLLDIDVIAKEDGSLLYYYALLLSRSSGKIAMLRLPQWEELRAKVRNNKLVFLKDGEVFTAKKDGSDLSRVLSSDSLPLIEGTLDYPALSPDGKSLAFTSRIRLYNGGYDEKTGDTCEYDNVYLYDIEAKKLSKLNLGQVNGFSVERPVFSTNGDRLVFSAKEQGGKWQIYEHCLETGATQRLFDADENVRFPYYSPDDRFVVFTTDYDGDEDIEIVDTQNPTVWVTVTQNSARDTLPVWNVVYPDEIKNPDYKIESKISFVSERDFHKGVYCVYLSRPHESDIRVFNMYTPSSQGGSPDLAAIEITSINHEGDYPGFTGDGKALVFEHFDGIMQRLKRFDFELNYDELFKENPNFILEDIEILAGALKPAGMKNTITNFKAENKNGDEIHLSWNRYTDADIYYTVQFKRSSDSEPLEKKVSSQTGAVLKGLEMGQEYVVRVCVIENNEEVTTSQWKKVLMPDVVARPSYEIDKDNPYLVRLHAWKPKPETVWNFTWIIDNNDIRVDESQDFSYEFATSGTKTILLKAADSGNNKTNISEPMEVNIVSDIKPVIEYVLAEDSSFIELNAGNSLGKRIDISSAKWTMSGPGRDPVYATGSYVIQQLNGFTGKINVNLTLTRIPVTGQTATDVLEKNLVIDLDLKEVKPIITYEVSELDQRLVHFSAQQSIGNIDWYGASWVIYADGEVLYGVNEVSTFDYQFPERNKDTVYTVSLTVPRRNDGTTETVSQVISIEATPIEPVIEYKILTFQQGSSVTVSKILLDCTKSKGSGIDFSQSKWSIPIAGAYGEQPTQFGPTAVYSLSNIEQGAVIEVALTLSRKGGADPITITKFINIQDDQVPESKLIVTRDIQSSSEGKVLVLDVLKSTGPNIDWERTEWHITAPSTGSFTGRGPVAQVTLPASSEEVKVNFTCTLYRYQAVPETMSDEVIVGRAEIRSIISTRRLSASGGNYYELSVLDSKGVSIDWERTRWYIYDGNENVVLKTGATISHAFAVKGEQMGYPVMVEMFLKGDTFPFVGYKTIDIEGDALLPIITYDTEGEDPNLFTFSAESSKGSNLDWNKTKWTFGDGSEAQYGPVVSHKYPFDSIGKKYRVSLTLTRTSVNGAEEVKTVFRDFSIGRDEIKPVVKAAMYDNGFLVLSAEESEGRGLLLDRSVWLFPGEGDTGSLTEQTHSGVIQQSSTNVSTSASRSHSETTSSGRSGGLNFLGFFSIGRNRQTSETEGSSQSHSSGVSYETVDYSKLKDNTESFSSSNSHTGAVCRRHVGNARTLVVSLFVYRMNREGGMQGESVTVRIDLKKARSSASSGGVVYGR